MVNYENFEAWFNELENFNFRSDRFFQHLDLLNSSVSTDQRNEFVTNWLRAAFEAGRNNET